MSRGQSLTSGPTWSRKARIASGVRSRSRAHDSRAGSGSCGSRWMRSRAAYGISSTVSTSTGAAARIGASRRSPSSGSPGQAIATRAQKPPRRGSGISGMGGSRSRAKALHISSGTVRVHSVQFRSTASACSPGLWTAPPRTVANGSSSKTMEVTTPTLPLPPHNAQNSSASWSGSVSRSVPSDVTTWKDRTRSVA